MIRTTSALALFLLTPQLAASQGLLEMVRARNFEVPAIGAGAPVIMADFKQVPNPAYQDPNELPPPNLKESHLQTLIGKMAAVEFAQLGPKAKPEDMSLRREDVMRLVGNLAIIDRNFVDSIPAEVWDKAVADMGEVAAKEFDVKKKNWEATVSSMLKTAAAKILDPFSVYWSQDEFKRFQDQMGNSFVGIGVILKEDGAIDIVIPGGPADKAGLKAGDKIVSVDGTAVSGSEQVMKKTLGKAGTPVSITVERGGKALPPAKKVEAPKDLEKGEGLPKDLKLSIEESLEKAKKPKKGG